MDNDASVTQSDASLFLDDTDMPSVDSEGSDVEDSADEEGGG